MADTQEIKKNTKSQLANSSKDLVIIAVVSVCVFILSYFFDVFVFIVRFLEKHPRRIIYLDEIITLLLTLSIGLAVFSWRRWLELKKETAERMKEQEEVIKLTATQAAVERIINKQLHADMDQMKQGVREILHLLTKFKT
ncbi:MAG: hypothetical protein PHS93_06720 [Candidatus Omnitrophica bacterium]|nr:hypothetical protein [Candidatus Omnitrophota bacterium]MDD5352842.1 hypothetical protein [Candidatus Omnitrophota bacterium]MDD5550441.1 hypothetical protein [Candidatus Omnitrophota bacterium]